MSFRQDFFQWLSSCLCVVTLFADNSHFGARGMRSWKCPFHKRSMPFSRHLKFFFTINEFWFVASLTQLVSSRPRVSSETFLLGKPLAITPTVPYANKMMTAVSPIRRDCCHHFVSERDFGHDAQRVCQAERSLNDGSPWPGRDELRKTCHEQWIILSAVHFIVNEFFSSKLKKKRNVVRNRPVSNSEPLFPNISVIPLHYQLIIKRDVLKK